ncbi:hypothetical protein ACM25P_03365 [Vreelandella alkaliphila]|uniref:hypothetical protein n=1 Tax=Vreelandella alkaliphila TaxID=272774 RepID=UPI0039F62198
MATPADTSPLSTSQTTLASRVLAEAVGDLARKGHQGDDLKELATGLASALKAGLREIATSAAASCSTPLSPCEQRQQLPQQPSRDDGKEGIVRG